MQEGVNVENFRLGMRSLAAAVSIVTTAHSGHRYGMTATAICSVSADPPALLACLNQVTSTHGALLKAGVFCVNVLRAEDAELSTAFAGGQSGDSRFRTREWNRLPTGAPALVDALASFDCRVVKTIEHGTHTIFVGHVEHILLGRKGKPLLYSAGQYAKLASLAHGEPLPEGLDYWGV